ncbi:uncharacterized protein LOC110823472 [Carica papaya]|uniref:uncharacterized protein LOC110823472 n=1 Tax=Carica papaya TaxID=3649 RepID=UPI000B8CEF67|nr:uncharacterized protein LOC110823472 [Carica papaya]
MYDPQHFVDLQDNSGFGDPKSWLSGDDSSSPTHSSLQSLLANAADSHSSGNGNVDRVLFNDLVEIVPLVESLIHRKASSSFTRRGSMSYTKTPSRESLSRKVNDPRGKSAAQSTLAKKKRDHGNKDQGKNGSTNQDGDPLTISPRALAAEREELIALREQVEDLRRKLVEKDELLRLAEISKVQMDSVHAKLDELRHRVAEKDALIRSTQCQLSDAKIKLADKQAALEKMQWEAMTSRRKAEKLQEELNSMQGDISSYMQLFEGLMKNNSTKYSENYDVTPYRFDHLPYLDDLDEKGMRKMEEAREAYIAALAAARERLDEESLAAAASARLYLQSLVFRS